jgi:hypothetical protein
MLSGSKRDGRLRFGRPGWMSKSPQTLPTQCIELFLL